jgi:hypothetical protein
MIPEFANLFRSKHPYSGRYKRVKGRRYDLTLLFQYDDICCSHVIICGHITPHSLASFLRDFLHKGREQLDEIDVVILDKYVLNTFDHKSAFTNKDYF